MLVGMALWWVPRWSIDENARRAALALVPDERRARVSFIIDLGPVALGLILSAPIAVAALLLDRYWLIPAVGMVVALVAIPYSLRVIRGWDDSLLNWRLRRRKQNRTMGLDPTSRTEASGGGDDGGPREQSQPRARRFRVSLRWKILVAFAGAFTIVFAFIAIWVFQYTTNTATQKLITQLEASAVGGAASINGEIFRDLVTTVAPVPDPDNPTGLGYPTSPLYTLVAEDLFAVNQIIPESMPYSYYRNGTDGQLYFAASGGYFFTPQFGVPYGVPVADVVNPETYALMEQGLSGLTSQPAYTDVYGSWISAYHPITNAAGTVVGAIGIDYPLTYVGEVQQSVQRQLYPVLLASYGVLLIMVLLLSTSLTRPLKKLTDATKRVSEGEYELDVKSMVPSRFPDEMYELAQSFAQMARKVGARERSLTQEVQRLKVEIDESRREEAVKQITETEFFSDLTVKAAEMRKRMRQHPGDGSPAARPSDDDPGT
jgi:HAMP domain-containing protein